MTLPNAIIRNLPFYPIASYPMLFDLFIQLTDYNLAVAITRVFYNVYVDNVIPCSVVMVSYQVQWAI